MIGGVFSSNYSSGKGPSPSEAQSYSGYLCCEIWEGIDGTRYARLCKLFFFGFVINIWFSLKLDTGKLRTLVSSLRLQSKANPVALIPLVAR